MNRKQRYDYSGFSLRKLNEPRFAHIGLLSGWLGYFALYFLTENLTGQGKKLNNQKNLSLFTAKTLADKARNQISLTKYKAVRICVRIIKLSVIVSRKNAFFPKIRNIFKNLVSMFTAD